MGVAAQSVFSGGRGSKSFTIDKMRFFADEGQICWENTETGDSGAMFPDEALARCRQLGRDLVSTNVENSSCRDAADRHKTETLMRRLEELAKEEMARMPSRKELSKLLWLPGQP